jgi:mannose-6-phosphate isomerase
MYTEPIFLKPVFQERIWGGKKLQTLYGYDIPNDQIGEAWVISAHKHGPSKLINGPLAGLNLLEVWEQHPVLFGKKTVDSEFPLLVKILDANDNLSVQVHPDDAYAQRIEGEQYGKTECWYVLESEENSEIIYGHNADSSEEFQQKVDAGKWDELLNKIKAKKGDFFYVPSGTIHALGEGNVILEIQQSSDITYRVYDYDRKDDQGNPRELHIESAMEVTNYPHVNEQIDRKKEKIADLVSTQLIKEDYFTVYHWKLVGEVSTPLQADYLLVSVINGVGEFVVNERTFTLKKGDNFIIPATLKDYKITGDIEFIVAHE